jgi:nicotinate-nucleotide adenylyltransferase
VKNRHIGVLGGTFDPVHFGHLRTAMELLEHLELDRMLLVPVGVPPHRAQPSAGALQRLHMLRLAVRGDPRLQVDDRECRKAETAYTVDTLRQLRSEVGDGVALSFCVGADAFIGMSHWHRWQELPSLAHIVVMSRPGWHLPDDLGALECWRDRFVLSGSGSSSDSFPASDGFPSRDSSAGEPDRLREQGAGRIVFVALTPMDISATGVRHRIALGQSARFLVPDSVWRYIQRNGLYGGAVSRAGALASPGGDIEQGDALIGEQ